jgi:hypothetical protein
MKNLLQKFCRAWEIGGLNEPYSRLSPWDLCGLECVDTPYRDKPIGFPEPGTRISADPIVSWLPRVRGHSRKEIGAAKWIGVETLLSSGGFAKPKYFSPELPLTPKLAAICTSN